MPNKDRTGPQRKRSGTGRGLGPCGAGQSRGQGKARGLGQAGRPGWCGDQGKRPQTNTRSRNKDN